MIRPYSGIIEANLSMSAQYRAPSLATMQIHFSDRRHVLVASTDGWLRGTPIKVQEYYRFKWDLHRRLVAAEADHISITTGYSASRANTVKLIFAFAAAFFTLPPLVLFFMTGLPKALPFMLTGLALIYPAIRAGQRNRPARYDPANPPDMLC